MAVIDKQDFYWNWALAWAVNNLYYDLINVDVVHPPYVNSHRNSSFFLKTRLGYIIADAWKLWADEWWSVEDIKMLRDDKCSEKTWWVYILWRKLNKKWLFVQRIEHDNDDTNPESYGCVAPVAKCTELFEGWCWNWRLFTTNYVKWFSYKKRETVEESGSVMQKIYNTTATEVEWMSTWIQINVIWWWTTQWYFSDENIENWYAAFNTSNIKIWRYLLVYESRNIEWDWHAWQVRLITWIDNEGRIMVDAPWDWFSVADIKDWKQRWYWLSYAIFEDWWEVVWFTNNNSVYIFPNVDDCKYEEVYRHKQVYGKWDIIWIAEAWEKTFILTDNWYVHYNNWTWWHNKFFINDDMDAWIDKTSVYAYKDIVLALGKQRIAVWVPDEQNRFWTMYNQAANIWLWNRYSYWEYEWDFLFVSNDKRLLALWVANTAWRYMLQTEDVGDMINWKLSAMVDTDEVFIWDWNNNLRIFVQTKNYPFRKWQWPDVITEWYRNLQWNNTVTHIYKFDTLFKIWTEDHVPFLLKWCKEWVFYWEGWLYVRRRSENKYWVEPGPRKNEFAWCDAKWDGWHTKFPYESHISAYMIENENNWLDGHPTLFQLAKLNRLITTLGPWVYSTDSKIRITAYSKWIWYTYEFPLNSDTLDNPSWIWLMSSYYVDWWAELSEEDEAKIKCMKDSIQDSQHEYVQKCPESKVYYHSEVQTAPWCDNYKELLTTSHWVCINDKLYELAPTMPLTASLGENQQYSTQIKIELIWWQGDIICFWWWLAELFIAPLWMIWPDWEYQMQTNTAC